MPDLVLNIQQIFKSEIFHSFYLVEPGIKNTSQVLPFLVPPGKELKKVQRVQNMIFLWLFFFFFSFLKRSKPLFPCSQIKLLNWLLFGDPLVLLESMSVGRE